MLRNPAPLLALIGLLLSASLLGAQEPDTAQVVEGRPNIFFDCQGFNCNSNYYRTEIPWVNWVRDREDSHLHVIMTSQATGAGGREYQLDFMGRDGFEEYEDQVFYRSNPTDTQRETLDGITHTLGIGFARFANFAGFRGLVSLEGVEIEGIDPTERVVAPGEVEDPWNLWVFRINANANLDGEETRETIRLNSNFSASRVTPTWKLDFDGRVNFNRQEVERSDGSIFEDTRTDWRLDALVVYSVARHWSVGFNADVGRSTRLNEDFSATFRPALEYSFFPYEEATRRALTAFYEIGPAYWDYEEETVFGELEETRIEESLEIEFSQRQPWGDASVSIEGSHFLHDFGKNRLSLEGDVSFRIFRGLSLNAEGNVEWVNDQLFLSAQGETDEEILLRLRQRGTDFNYGVQFGFSFQFGSIFNNVVNNRFSGGGGGFGGFGGGRGGGPGD